MSIKKIKKIQEKFSSSGNLVPRGHDPCETVETERVERQIVVGNRKKGVGGIFAVVSSGQNWSGAG